MSETLQKNPVNVYVEMTPNPKTMKFVSDVMIYKSDNPVEYLSASEAFGNSALAEKLFEFPFIEKVFIVGNFVSISKNDSIDWEIVHADLREFIRDFLQEGNIAVNESVPEKENTTSNDEQKEAETSSKETPSSPYDEQIKELLDEYVKPAVENDGGAIDFKSYDHGVVTVTLRGACSGCPSSTMTLKGGIESLLKQYIPEVRAVVAEEG